MKKLFLTLLAAFMVCSLAGCSSSTEETASEETTEETVGAATGKYTVYNGLGETVTELYLYETGSSEKGDNLAGEDGLKAGKSIEISYDGTAETELTLEFTGESGTTDSFTTLHMEETPLTLLAEDARTGATVIAFEALEGTGIYTVYNTTGEAVTELYLYESGTDDKGENFAVDGFADGENMVLTYTGLSDATLTLEFITESGVDSTFETLHIEEVPVSLLAEDARTGATAIRFSADE